MMRFAIAIPAVLSAALLALTWHLADIALHAASWLGAVAACLAFGPVLGAACLFAMLAVSLAIAAKLEDDL